MKKRGEKGIGAPTVVTGLIALAVTFALFVFLINYITSKADNEAVEKTCYAVNAAKAGLDVGLLQKFGYTPQGCRTINKGELPTTSTGNIETNVKEDIRLMIEKCWDMWGSGYQNPDGTNKDIIDGQLAGGKKCFTCYTFTIPKNIQIAPAPLAEHFALRSHKVRDLSDACSLQGGYCKNDCGTINIDNGKTIETTTVSSGVCPATTKCCVPKQSEECKGRGGECRSGNEAYIDEGNNKVLLKHTWLCSSGQSCYVKKENFQSTADYIQSGGKGFGLLSLSNRIIGEGLKPETDYAIVFNEDQSIKELGGIVGGSVLATTVGIVGVKATLGVAGALASTNVIGGIAATYIIPPVGIAVTAIAVVGGGIYAYYELRDTIGSAENNALDVIIIGTKEELKECALDYSSASRGTS